MIFTSGNSYSVTLSGDDTDIVGTYTLDAFFAVEPSQTNRTGSSLTFSVTSGGADAGSGTPAGGGGGGGSTEIIISNQTLGALQKRIDRYLFFFPWSEEKTLFKELIKTNKEIRNCKVTPPFACNFNTNQANALIEIDVIQKNYLFWTIPDKEGEIELTSIDGEVTRVPLLLRVYNFNYVIPLKPQVVAGIKTSKDIKGIPIWLPILLAFSIIGYAIYKVAKDKNQARYSKLLRQL